MTDYSSVERVDILHILGECHTNYRQAATLYRARYPERRHPNHATIRKIYLKAQQGHLVRVRRNHNYDENDVRVLIILATVYMNPHISSYQIERETGIPRRTVLRILRNRQYHPYHITLTQAITPNDMRIRMQFCQWAQQMIRNDPAFFRYVMFSDEASFKNNGELNRHNCHYWLDTNPHWYRQIENQHRWSINVWCGIINGYLIGPYFFYENVNGENFLAFLTDELLVLLEEVDLYIRLRMWIQLDGAAPHYSRHVRGYLNRRFNGKWIGQGGPVAWPARSPDITSPDFYLWGYLKNIVYKRAPTTREDMMERITIACRNIPRAVLLNTIEHFHRRIQLCIQENGIVFEHLM